MSGSESAEVEMPGVVEGGQLREIRPVAYQTAQDVVQDVGDCYYPNKNYSEQTYGLKEKRVGQVVREAFSGKDGEDAWQGQWMTVFKAFRDLGVSKFKGDGDGRGSDECRFIVRALQSELVEVGGDRRVIDASCPKDMQTPELRAMAKFALAAAKLDHDAGRTGGSESLLDVFEGAVLGRGEIKKMLEADAYKKDIDKEFSIRNI